MRIRVCQCLCPSRHALLGFGLNDEDTSDDEAHTMLFQVIQATIAGHGAQIGVPIPKMNPWCGLCGAPATSWIYEVKWSKEFSNWDEAQEALKDLESRQMLTLAVADMLGISYDARRKRSAN